MHAGPSSVSQAEDPGQRSSYWFYMAALGGVYGDLLCSRCREFRSSLGSWGSWAFSFLSYYAIKAPWPWGIAFWAFCTGLICGTPRGLLCIDEGPLGGIGAIAPGSCDMMPMGSKRFTLPTGHRVRVSLAQNRISALEISERPKIHLLGPKKPIYSNTPNPPQAPGVLEGGATKGGARAREFRNSQGAPKPVFGALWASI
jgi:hypothetical protein